MSFRSSALSSFNSFLDDSIRNHILRSTNSSFDSAAYSVYLLYIECNPEFKTINKTQAWREYLEILTNFLLQSNKAEETSTPKKRKKN